MLLRRGIKQDMEVLSNTKQDNKRLRNVMAVNTGLLWLFGIVTMYYIIYYCVICSNISAMVYSFSCVWKRYIYICAVLSVHCLKRANNVFFFFVFFCSLKCFSRRLISNLWPELQHTAISQSLFVCPSLRTDWFSHYLV